MIDRIEDFIAQNYERDKTIMEARISSNYKILSDCMVKLDKKIDELDLIPNPERKPHKCPVCEGRKTHVSLATNKAGDKAFVEENCICCEGKGIIWG